MASRDDRRPARADANPSVGDRPHRPGPPRPDRPEFPPDARASIPKRVRSELRSVMRGRPIDDVALALTLAGEAIDADDPDTAVPYLRWAKGEASRSAAVREALGVALYLAGSYQEALNELRAYRRLSGAHDQEHVVADCLRALEHPVTEVAQTVEDMLEDDDVPAERRIEGVLVWASAVADAGDVAAGRAVLRRLDRRLASDAPEESVWRLRYVAGDLAARDDDPEAALEALGPLAALDGDPYEVAARVRELRRA